MARHHVAGGGFGKLPDDRRRRAVPKLRARLCRGSAMLPILWVSAWAGCRKGRIPVTALNLSVIEVLRQLAEPVLKFCRG